MHVCFAFVTTASERQVVHRVCAKNTSLCGGLRRTLSPSVFDYFCRMVLLWKKKMPDSTASVLVASALSLIWHWLEMRSWLVTRCALFYPSVRRDEKEWEKPLVQCPRLKATAWQLNGYSNIHYFVHSTENKLQYIKYIRYNAQPYFEASFFPLKLYTMNARRFRRSYGRFL